jgi:hypothetical protein
MARFPNLNISAAVRQHDRAVVLQQSTEFKISTSTIVSADLLPCRSVSPVALTLYLSEALIQATEIKSSTSVKTKNRKIKIKSKGSNK